MCTPSLNRFASSGGTNPLMLSRDGQKQGLMNSTERGSTKNHGLLSVPLTKATNSIAKRNLFYLTWNPDKHPFVDETPGRAPILGSIWGVIETHLSCLAGNSFARKAWVCRRASSRAMTSCSGSRPPSWACGARRLEACGSSFFLEA